MEEKDIIICVKKKKKEYQKNYRESNKNRNSEESRNLIKKCITISITNL